MKNDEQHDRTSVSKTINTILFNKNIVFDLKCKKVK